MTEPPLPSSLREAVPPALEAICLRCLAKKPAERYPTAAALAEDLQRFLEDKPGGARPTAGIISRLLTGEEGRGVRGWRRLALAVASVAVVCLLAGGLWLWLALFVRR